MKIDQAYLNILLGLLEDIYAAVDSCETAQEILYNQKEVDDQRAERLAKTHDPLALMANSNNPFNYPVFHQDQPSPSTYMQQPQPINNNYNPQPSFNQNYMQQPMPNPEDITDPTTAMNMALQIAQPGMNMGQDRQMRMVGANGGNQFRQYAGQNVGNQNGYNAVQNVGNQVVQNAVQNQGVQNVGNQNGIIVVPGITNQNPNGNGNVVAARAEGNATGNNGNQIRCYNCRGLGHLARNCTVRPRRRDAAYLQTQLLIAQKEEAGIQSKLQASTSGTQADKAPVYNSDGSAECGNKEGGTVDLHPATVEEYPRDSKISLIGFPAQAEDLPPSPQNELASLLASSHYRNVSKQTTRYLHKSLFDVAQSRISIFTVKLKYHSDVLGKILRISIINALGLFVTL
ncbi:retrovirus-related pol polyprotein from transposon TNT 1-94 [Tanacetum coccineum]